MKREGGHLKVMLETWELASLRSKIAPSIAASSIVIIITVTVVLVRYVWLSVRSIP